MAGGQSWHTGGMSMTDPVTVAGTGGQGAGGGGGGPLRAPKPGQIRLKGKNRHQFERMLQTNIRAAARDTGLPVELLPREGVVGLLGDRQERTAAEHAAAVDRVAERVSDVPGIVRVCRAVRVPKTPEAAVAAAIELTSPASGAFAVRPRRRDKRFPVTSSELAVIIGREVQAAHGL